MSFSHIKIHDYEMRYKALAERSTFSFTACPSIIYTTTNMGQTLKTLTECGIS